MIINHNLAAMNTYNQMGANQLNASKNMEKLSSGLRINRAGDDAAGLSISEKMRGQIRGLEQASRNSQDGISLLQTAEGGLNESHSILQRMRELAVQASNDTNNVDDRKALQTEANQLAKELNRITTNTEFNTESLLDGTSTGSGAFNFQVGANQDQTISITISNMTGSTGLSVATADDETADAIDISSTNTVASAAITTIDTAITLVSEERSKLGAVQNRLEHSINNLGTTAQNLTAAESRIRDVDMAKEMMDFTKNNILNQASQAMLAQANQSSSAVLQLLR
ncbi:flagellin Hag [Bacillus sp. N1-1]|uniref:flagellin Hag n=1 Tax=Bacillus sp. N1-1 TaxID=2682541 RepID=UPI001318E7C8|nr:flagellin Hag [Bacillus sp. N1-1]QHA93913.1 flagellin Hag [Bacillus sp. N1-1]